MTRRELGVGVWTDDAGTLHNGYEPTAENMARLEKAARDVFGAAGIPVDEVDDA